LKSIWSMAPSQAPVAPAPTVKTSGGLLTIG
jgi:hypothetical protein